MCLKKHRIESNDCSVFSGGVQKLFRSCRQLGFFLCLFWKIFLIHLGFFHLDWNSFQFGTLVSSKVHILLLSSQSFFYLERRLVFFPLFTFNLMHSEPKFHLKLYGVQRFIFQIDPGKKKLFVTIRFVSVLKAAQFSHF